MTDILMHKLAEIADDDDDIEIDEGSVNHHT